MSAVSVSEIETASLARFEDDLLTEGLARKDRGSATDWAGSVSNGDGKVTVEVRIVDGFPFTPPKVYLPGYVARSGWHQETDGALCLWGEAEGVVLPWLDAKRTIAKIESWLDADAAGWPDDEPALDLEAYLSPDSDLHTVLIEDWNDLDGRWLILQKDGIVPTRLSVAETHQKSAALKKSKASFVGVAVDLGEIQRPIRDWDGLAAVLGSTRSDDASVWARYREAFVVIARYSRGGRTGLMALAIRGNGDSIEVSTLIASDSTVEERELRGGVRRPELANFSVAVVGLGAVGSRVADELARAGVGTLHLVDGEVLQPGNLIRHLCGPHLVGLSKVNAVELEIESKKYPCDQNLSTSQQRIRSLQQGVDLLSSFDLVIDATASGPLLRLLTSAARVADAFFLSVAVEGHGQFARVDVIPLPPGQTPLESGGVDEVKMLTSNGCGDPVSPTPPSAATVTAALGANEAIAHLLGARSSGVRVRLAAR